LQVATSKTNDNPLRTIRPCHFNSSFLPARRYA